MVKIDIDVTSNTKLGDAPQGKEKECALRKLIQVRSKLETDVAVAVRFADELQEYEAWKLFGLQSMDELLAEHEINEQMLDTVRDGYRIWKKSGGRGKCTGEQARTAREEAKTIRSGAPEGNDNAAKARQAREEANSIHDNVMNCSKPEQGNSASYLLRRIARDHPDILDRYEAGEFASVRQAAIAAGIVKVKTPAEIAIAALKKCTHNQWDEVVAWMNANR